MAGVPSEEEKPYPAEWIHILASSIAGRGLATPAIVFLELLEPLSFVGSQLLWVLDPLLNALVGDAGRRYARLLEDRRNVSELLGALEAQNTQVVRHRRPPV